ncbi:helix-turn-helix domain-containing protein [Streptomyces aureoverticillatus]|uniref:helix-turn-helix domain-containing protein n=1 Tax=Streptomyces aureoverticillatus TaxID=66871 RepID=UPI0013D9D0E8|nr:helix-turn-helix transcriptional regulator [Streptomyces aureoverticillatus]QIB48217.1 helix-turn-helix transcriptional regulator [Streptomyces aureoverticillatus]
MTIGVERAVSQFSGVAGEATTVLELGRELARELGHLVPHDGFMLSGLDPLTRVSCFLSGQHTYSYGSLREVLLGEFRYRDRHPFGELWRGASQIGVLGSGVREERDSVRLHEVMAPQGFGSEMRLALVSGGLLWGTMALVRERGRPCFTAAEAVHAQCAVAPLAQALRHFVTRRTPHPLRSTRPPAVVVIDGTDRIRAATPEGRAWLRACLPGFTGPDSLLRITYMHITVMARCRRGPVVNRIPTPDGWIEMHAQLLADTGTDPGAGEVALTIQPATARTLLPAVAAWYGITAREVAVLREALEGLPAKQIARRLGVSPHTVNDHFKALYRKVGVSAREELLATLSH